jgi:hypothetical protein
MGDTLKLIWWVTRAFSVASLARNGDPDLSPPAQRAAKKSVKPACFQHFDGIIFASLYRLAPGILNALVIVKQETAIGWHRAGFRLFWHWKSRSRGARSYGSE